MTVVPLSSTTTTLDHSADEDMQIDPDSPRDAPKKGQNPQQKS